MKSRLQGPKPYPKAYMESVKKFLEKVDVEWNSPILEWGTNLTGLLGSPEAPRGLSYPLFCDYDDTKTRTT